MNDEDTADVDEAACRTIGELYDDPAAGVRSLRGYRPDDETVRGAGQVFGALANEDRLRLLETLRHGERCVCELQVALDAPQSTVATHLRKLRDAGLVRRRRKGRWTYYRIADTAVMDVLDLAASIGAV